MPTGVNRPAKQKRTGRRKHSFGGCRTCRRRHVRCDQIRPACLACRAINAVCEGYASDVRWMPPSTLSSAKEGQLDVDDGSKSTIRHHLYSEASRASMSRAITCTDIDGSLAEVDARTEGLQKSGSGDIVVGPFGVLKIDVTSGETRSPHDSVLGPCQPVLLEPSPNENMSSFEILNDDIAISNETQNVPSVIDWFDPILGFDNTLHWADLFGLDFDSGNSLLMPQQHPPPQDFSLGNFLPESLPELPPVSLPVQPQRPLEETPPHNSQGLPQTEVTSATEGEQYSIVLSEVKSVKEAEFLLKHFHDAVIPQMAFMPTGSKSPWTILQMPEAMRSLSELSYLHSGRLKHANMANLYGIMACSAYHLAASRSTLLGESPEYWAELLERLKAKAKTHMQISLRDELKGEHKAKYKDQLMAILSMLALTSISGHQRDARFYMIDAERLLRIKGLAKRDISRKCRLLHHVYTWIRIVGESTYVIHDYESFGPVVDNMSAAHKAGRLHGNREKHSSHSRSHHNARLDDFIRLEPHSSDSDLDIDDFKENEGGLIDIHLEDSRLYSNTLYHIYGISETWLSLVSQTTRLANILDAAKHGKNTDVNFMDFLQKRAGRLENIVCTFALKDPTSDDDEDGIGSVTGQHSPNHHMLRAMNSALVILFYRRIRNVNPLILQGHVDSVVNSLRDFDASLVTHSIQGPGSAWPAFIAGCEALSRRNRTFLMSWLEKGFKKCGLEYFGVSRRLMGEVWERQDEPTPLLDPGSGGSGQSRSQKSSSYHRTWVDVSRERKEWVMLF